MLRKRNAQDKSTEQIEKIHSAIAVFGDGSQCLGSSIAGSLGLDETVKMVKDYRRNRNESETIDFRYELARGRYSAKLDQAAV